MTLFSSGLHGFTLSRSTVSLRFICISYILVTICVHQKTHGLKLKPQGDDSDGSNAHQPAQDIISPERELRPWSETVKPDLSGIGTRSNPIVDANKQALNGAHPSHPGDKRNRHHQHRQHRNNRGRQLVDAGDDARQPWDNNQRSRKLNLNNNRNILRSQYLNSGKNDNNNGDYVNDEPLIANQENKLAVNNNEQLISNGINLNQTVAQNVAVKSQKQNESDLNRTKHKDKSIETRDIHEVTTQATVPVNTVTSPDVVPDEPDVLQNLVLSLQAQLKDSQVHTRSILNVVQEKQDAQEQDLQKLKNSISDLSNEQKQDRASIKALEKIAENNNWAISDLKTSNDQIRNDFTAFKSLQLAHNETMLELESVALHNEIDHDSYHKSIKHLQHEVHSIKSQIYRDKISLNRLTDQFGLAGAGNFGRVPTTAPSRQDSREMHSVPNNIPIIVPTQMKYEGYEGSGDKSNEVSKEFDKLASSIEEKHNLIGNHIEKILAKERKLEKDMDRIHKKVSLYEGELAKVYTMFFNLSLQMANIEKKILTKQQEHLQQDLQNLQGSFMNFTHQIFQLQKSHDNSKKIGNSTWQNQQEINQMEKAVNEYYYRLKHMETDLNDAKAANQQSYMITNNQLSRLNDTVQKARKLLTDHNQRASDVFKDVSTKMMDFNTRLQHNDDRITRMEVKVLNASLNSCEKSNTDLTQDNFLSNLDRELNKVDRRVEDIADTTSKLDKGMSNLYDIADTQGIKMTKIVDSIQEVLMILPNVKGLKKEVSNFVRQLPADCKEIGSQSRDPKDGSYLIHPGKSPGSAWVPCEFSGEDTWTVIQRRQDGSLSFAKTWDDYKYGFGEPDSEYWIGNENLHYLTSKGNYILHVDMWDLNNQHWYAQYNHFEVDNEDENFSLRIGGYEGNATDAMKYSNYMPFSTMDHDNDVSSTHCAKFYTAGWWYKHCHYGNLNGRYTVGIVWFNHDFDEWVQMQRTVMRIRPRRSDESQYNRLNNSTEEKDKS